MAFAEDLKNTITRMGVPTWSVLEEVVGDTEFSQLLTPQEASILNTIRQSPSNIEGYREYVTNIVAKYYSWKIYKDSGLKRLTSEVNKLEIELRSAKENLDTQIASSQKDLDDLAKFAKLTSGATSLAAYSEDFSNRATTHAGLADKLKKEYFRVLFALMFVIGAVFFLNLSDFDFIKSHLAVDVMVNLTLGAFVLKAIILFFGFQVAQFFRKNYNAEKHLKGTYRHRSDVLKSLHAVYNSLDNKEEKDKLLAAGALFAYERGETGYITTKEGAGSGESLTEKLFSTLLK